ncbi:SusD/RagB family nutrient-binding outer membrane lipoprotein [Bacteroides sp. 519]|uniref:SusD/RagB family nutrient-binding outer membrane lipoprotein n=1 Tax=Bacteroides sp. 519 TaxID=2302937 RepID=UPI0013CF9334|nr:SusD/RagB family nutrient-binding outer membrane lipoprotein [Bacteroides sp. 519]NDV60533.1 SusD/RagB family nutrient-binding outer membrane lipoprotein [Bacteroides sp. 519]
MNFVRNTVSKEYSNGREITDEYIESYLANPKIAYKVNGTQIDRLKQIWIQNYIARFYHMQYDDYYDYRRNTYPEFPINPNTNLNDDKNKIPMRWRYPQNELLFNKEEYLAALERQWGGTDNVNNVMWLLK